MLKVTLLGTGGTQPLPERALAAAAVSVGGHNILLDCGEGTQVGLRRYGVSAYRLSAVLLTHYHGDHILGLPGLLQTLGSLNRTEPLTIYGPRSIEAVSRAIMALAGPQAYPVRWQQADAPFTVNELQITPFPLTHRVPCCGYALALPRAGKFDPARARAAGIPIEYWGTLQKGETVGGFTPEQVLGAPRRGLKVVYATDSRPCPAIVDAARDADLLCMDATYADDADLDKAKLYGHATCRETGETAAAAQVRRLWLTHYSAAVTDSRPCPAIVDAARDADLLCMDATYADDADLDKAKLYGHATCRETGETAAAAQVRRLWLTHYSAAVSDTAPGLAAARAVCPAAVAGYDGLTEELEFDKT